MSHPLLRHEGCGSGMTRGENVKSLRQSRTTSVSEAFRSRGAPSRAKVIILRIGADCENGLDLRHGCEQFVMPYRAAFTPRRQIALARIVPRKTKSHRNDGNAPRVVKRLAVDAHP